MRRLHRPDAFTEPVNQGKIIRRAAKQRLAKMNVSLHETWQKEETARVNNFIGVLINRGRRPERCYAPALNQNVSFEDMILIIERNDGGAFDEQRFFH
jgi:hypothetical protein